MKLKFDFKNKKGEIDSDVEKLVDKGMDIHERNWKDKFITKHNAKKEIMELKHKQQMEKMEEQSHTRKNFVDKIIDARSHEKEIELEKQRQESEEKRKMRLIKIIVSIILSTIGLVMIIVGIILTRNINDPDSSLHMLSLYGFLFLISPGVIDIFVDDNDNKNKKKK